MEKVVTKIKKNMRKSSLTVICHNLDCGGTEKVLTNIVFYYSKKNIKTTIITLGPAKIFSGLQISRKTKIIELPINYYNNIILKTFEIINLILKINKYMKNNQDSVFLSFLTIPNILTSISSFNININHYVSERINPKFVNLSIHWRLLRFITYQKIDSLIVQTEEIKKHFLKYVPERKINVIPNSVITKKRSIKIEKYNKKKLKVIFIGRLEYQKGIDIVVESIVKIFNSKNKDKYIFEIIGQGSLSKFVESAIEKNNLSSYVRLIKGSNKPDKIIKNADIILHPSRYEGLSNVVLEAMAAGKCVISTVQSSSEIIKNNEDGILMKEITALELIKNIDRVSKNRILLKDIGTNAISKINDSYSEETILKSWNKLLKIDI